MVMNFLRKMVWGGMFLANVAAALLLLLSVLSPYVSPKVMMLPSLLGITFPLWAVLNLFFLIYWIWQVKWMFLLSLLTLFFSFHEISNYFPFHFSTEKIPENSIKVMTYNCMAFQDMHQKKEENLVDYINKCNADIVCLQEYAYAGAKNAKKIDTYFSKYPYRRFVPLDKNQKNAGWGIACLSRFPIKKVERIGFRSNTNLSAAFTLELPGDKDLIVVNNHLESNKLNAKDRELYNAVWTTFNPESIKGIRSTLLGKLMEGYRLRAPQADTLRNYIRRHSDQSMIVCGDFNDTQVSYAYRTIRGDMCDAFGKTGTGLGITFNEDFFFFRIDHLLHSRDIRAYNCIVDKVKYSDHYPVISYFSIPGVKILKEKKSEK